MTVRGLPPGLVWNLSVFADRVAELLEHPLVRAKPLRAPHHIALILHEYGGVPLKNSDVLDPIEDRVDRIVLNDLLRLLRQFDMESEPTNIEKLVKALVRQPIEDSMRRGAVQCLKEFSLKRLPRHLQVCEIMDGFDLTPGSAYDLYLYGDRFHGKNRQKRERWKALNASRFEPLLYSALLHAAVAKANAVIEFYRLLRVHGHVKPVPGDPTYTPDALRHVPSEGTR